MSYSRWKSKSSEVHKTLKKMVSVPDSFRRFSTPAVRFSARMGRFQKRKSEPSRARFLFNSGGLASYATTADSGIFKTRTAHSHAFEFLQKRGPLHRFAILPPFLHQTHAPPVRQKTHRQVVARCFGLLLLYRRNLPRTQLVGRKLQRPRGTRRTQGHRDSETGPRNSNGPHPCPSAAHRYRTCDTAARVHGGLQAPKLTQTTPSADPSCPRGVRP